MTMNRAEYAALVETAKAAAAAYYADGTSELSDAEYDRLLARIAHIEAGHPEWVDGTPVSQSVAAGGVAGGDVEHSVPMLSLDNAYSTDDLAAFFKRTGITEFAVEPKLDGLAVAIRYENGHPVQMVTRGDGLHGEDVTYAMRQIVNLPHSLGIDIDIEVRGEVIFTRTQFLGANCLRETYGDKPFVNARNGAAGALRGAKDRAYIIPMSFFAYDVVDGLRNVSHIDAMKWLGDLRFDTAQALIEPVTDDIPSFRSEDVMAIVEAMSDPQVRAMLPVETDGLVIKADRADEREALGAGSKAPRWAVAYKFAAVGATTKLLGFDMEVGRTGVITPRAILEPVFVGGTTITYATLHNFEDVARRDIRVGDTVEIVRAGEVIPRVESVIVADRDGTEQVIEAPTSCPRCGGDVDASQARLRCVKGRKCGLVESISYAVGRDALDIDGLGQVQVAAMVEAGLVNGVSDLFNPNLTADIIAALPSGKTYTDTAANRKAGRAGQPVPVGDKTADGIKANIEKAREQATFARVLTALGIRLTGRSMSRRIASHFENMDHLRLATVEQLMAVDGIGVEKAAAIREELNELGPVIADLVRFGVKMPKANFAAFVTPENANLPDIDGNFQGPDQGAGSAIVAVVGENLSGKSICVTGSMKGALAGLSRNEVNELIESLGARAASSVSKSTDLLVVGENAGSKKAKAEQLAVRIVTEAEFAAMIGRA